MRRGRVIGAALLILVGLALWASSGEALKAAPAAEQRVSEAVGFAAHARAPAPARPHPQSADGYGPGALPHPITDDHRRLYRDADLLHDAQAALAGGDAPRARTLLAQHSAVRKRLRRTCLEARE